MSPIALSDAIIVTYMTIHMAWSPESKAIHKTHHCSTISFEGGAIRLNDRRAQKWFECDFLATKAWPADTVSKACPATGLFLLGVDKDASAVPQPAQMTRNTPGASWLRAKDDP